MKMIKKTVSFIMCIVVIISFFIHFEVESVAAIKTVKTSQIEIYEGLLGEVGVSLRDESGKVSRGEFLSALIKLMNLPIYNEAEKIFEDVRDTVLASNVEYAVDIGAIAKASHFNPNDCITYQQACKMVIEALGYGNEAKYSGGYPYGYVIVADRIDLSKGVESENELSYNDALVLLGNMMETPVRVVVGVGTDDGRLYQTYGTGHDFMYLYHNIYKVSGVVEADEKSYIGDSTISLNSGYVLINGVKYALENDIYCPLGSKVDAYIKVKNDNDNIFMCIPGKNTETYEIYAEDSPSFSDGVLKYFENEKEVKLLSEPSMAVIYNGKAYEYFKNDDFEIKDGYIEAIDNDADRLIDVFRIWNPTYCVVEKYDSYDGIIYDVNRKNNITIKPKAIIDSSFEMRDLQKNDVIEVFVANDKNYIKVNLVQDIATGTINEITSDGLMIGEKEYVCTDYFKNTGRKNVAIGTQVSVALSREEKIVAFISDRESMYTTAYLDDCIREDNVGRNILMKLFCENGEVAILKMSSSVTVNGERTTLDEAYSVALSFRGSLVRYVTDKEGNVCGIYFPSAENGIFDPLTDDAESLKRFRFAGDETSDKIPYKIFGYFVPHFVIDANTVIFCVSTDEDEDVEKFKIGSGLRFLGNDTLVAKNTIIPFNVTVDGVARFLLYKTASYSSASTMGTSRHAVVVGYNEALDNKGEIGIKVTLYSNNYYSTYFVNADKKVPGGYDFGNGTITFTKGDLIRYVTDPEDEYIISATLDFDAKNEKLIHSAGDNTELHYYYGDVYAVGENSIAVKKEDNSIVYIPKSLGNVGYIDDNDVYTVQGSRVKSFLDVGNECNKILVKCRYSEPNAIYIYE